MQLVLAICNVLIRQVSVPAMLDIKGQNVMVLVVVIQLVQAAHHVISPQVNALAILDTQGLHVIHVPPTTTEQVMELVLVSIIF